MKPNSRPRVLVLNQFALPETEAGGTRHVDLFGRLKGFDTAILAGDRNHASQVRYQSLDDLLVTVPVPASNRGVRSRLWGWLAYCIGAIRYVLRNDRFDIVYGSSPHLFAPCIGWLVARLTRSKFILEIRDLWPESFVSAGLISRDSLSYRIFRSIEVFLCLHCDHIVVVTAGWEEHFAEIGVPSDRVTVIPNGADPRNDIGIDDLANLRSSGYARVGIFAGSHGPKDGLDDILVAARNNAGVGIVLIGEGPEKASAVREASDLDNVVFLDPVAKSELGSLLAGADFGIHSVSDMDVFRLGMSPNKLFDYMSVGLPIVSNAGSGVDKIIDGADVGFIGESGSLAGSVRRMANAGSADMERFGANSRNVLVQNFSRSASAKVLSSVLHSTLYAGR